MIIGFFEALFGSMYIGGRLLGEKLQDTASNARQMRYNEIRDIVTDSAREYQLENELVCKLSTTKLSNMIPKEDVEFIFGRDYESILGSYHGFIRCDGFSDHGFYDINSILFNVILSQNGLIRMHRLIAGYCCHTPVNGLRPDEKDGICQRACEVIDRNIRKAHPNLDIYLCESVLDANGYEWSVSQRSCNIHRPPSFKSGGHM